MLVRCPQCHTEFRLLDYGPDDKVVRYLCPGCRSIVQLDLEIDEVDSTSSAGSFRSIERRKTVLVADDTPELLEMAQRRLDEAGYHVLLAGDGVEALRLIREKHPDLVVLDLLMPRLTGFDVLREMRREERIAGIPVIAFSGVYRDGIGEFLQRLGAAEFVEKSRMEELLVDRVRRILHD